MNVEKHRLDLRPGSLYYFRGIAASNNSEGGIRWKWPPATYKFLGVFHDYRSGQPMCGYVGVDGPDEGKHLLTTFSDWLRDFKRIADESDEPAPPLPPVPEKVAGFKSMGNPA